MAKGEGGEANMPSSQGPPARDHQFMTRHQPRWMRRPAGPQSGVSEKAVSYAPLRRAQDGPKKAP